MEEKIKIEEKVVLNKGLKYWLRWIAVFPGALFAGVLASLPLHWALYLILSSFLEPYPELPERLLSPFVIAAVFIWTGSRIAPEYKIETSAVLFGLWLFLLGGFVFLALSGNNLGGYQLRFYGGGIAPIMAAAGAFTGLYLVRRDVRS